MADKYFDMSAMQAFYNELKKYYGKKENDVYYVTASYNTTTYPTYSTAASYATGAYVVTGNRVYSAKSAVSPGTWAANSSKFTTASTTVVWTANTTAPSEVTALTDGLKIALKVPTLSGGATTQLNLNGLGAKTIKINNNTNLTTHLTANSIVYLGYNGTAWCYSNWWDGNSNVTQNSAADNQNYPFILKRTTGGNETNTVKYSSAATYNPSTRELKIVASNGEDSVSITPAKLSCTYGEMSQPYSAYISDLIEVTSYFTNKSAKSACSATSAKNAGTADNALKVYHSAWNANSARPVVFTETASGYSQVGTAANFTYNPSTKLLNTTNLSCANITATGSDGNVGITVGDSFQSSTAYITPTVISMDEGG